VTGNTIIKDLRAMFGEARDQGQRPTCLAFAVSDAHAAIRGQWEALSAEYLFYWAQNISGRPATSGALLHAILNTLQDRGQPHEVKWIYLVQLPADLASWQPPAGITPLFRRKSEGKAKDFETIISELNSNKPALLLLNLSRAFYSADKDTIIDLSPASKPDPQRRHAVVAVGHGTVGGQRAILVRNSWGSNWGNGGYAWVTESFLAAGIFGVVVLGENVDVPSSSVAA